MSNNFTVRGILVILINQLKAVKFLMFTGDFTKMVKGLTKREMKRKPNIHLPLKLINTLMKSPHA